MVCGVNSLIKQIEQAILRMDKIVLYALAQLEQGLAY